ncbi:MAG: HAD-IA family hydrolase [Oscillospiraceae bacterium]|nr:HAD-IA family hydrolase [Oscillospiraceae bacterium]
MEALERGEMTKPQILVGRFIEFFAGEGIDSNIAEAFNSDYQIALGDTVVVNDNAIDIIKEEKKSCCIVIVTNGTSVAQKKKLKASGLDKLADYIFISEDVGFEKPHRKYFDVVISAVGITDLADVLIVGDSLTSDIQGGCNVGIDTCWYNPHGKRNDSALIPTYTIGNLHELESVIQ